MKDFINTSRKAIFAGIAAGAASYQGGATWQVALAAGVAAAAIVWSIPNATAA